MTERIETPTGTLTIQRTSEVGRTFVMVTKDGDRKGLRVPTFELLAAIDAAEPESMRAYLRETAPEVIADLYRPAPAAAEHFDYLEPVKVTPERLDAVPEADSPEDVDERPNVDQARAAGEQLGKIMRAFGDAYAEAMKR